MGERRLRQPRRANVVFAFALLAGLCSAGVAGGGCAKSGASSDTGLMTGSRSVDADIAQRIRSDVMGFADTHSGRVTQALDAIIATEPPVAVRGFAIQMRVGNPVSAMGIAVEPNPFVALLDMVVMVTLKRQSVERLATDGGVLAGHGDGLLAAMRRSESDAWALADRYLSKSQVAELHEQIRLWRVDNPEFDYVGFVRFTDFGAFRQFQNAPGKARPGSLFSLLYVDPLAKLDPVAQEMHGYRALSERLTYMVSRMPLLLGLEARAAVWHMTTDPAVQRIVVGFEKSGNGFERAADGIQRFAEAAQAYPADLGREREAAVAQIAKEVTAQREAVVKDLEQREGAIRAVLADAKTVVESTQHAAASIRTTADGLVAGAVDTGEQATRRTIDHAFNRAVMLVAICLVGVPLSALTYRLLSRRAARRHGDNGGSPAGTMRIA